MKNFKIYSSFAVAISMILFFSCTTEDDFISQNTEVPTEGSLASGIQLLEYTNAYAKGGGATSSLLVFSDLATFTSTVTTLENNIEAYDDAFIAQYPNLDGDQLSDKEQTIGFDTYKPLKDFEATFKFSNSMRKDYKVAETNWLNKPDLIEADDPDKDFYELDEEEMTVLNNVGAVKIGNSIFKVFDGGVAEITDGDLFTLNRIAYFLCADFANETASNIVVYGGCVYSSGGNTGGGNNPPPTNYCFSNGENRTSWNTATRHKLKGIVKVVDRPYLWGVKIKSVTKYYKKIAGVWLRRRSDLTAALDGVADEISENNCGDFAVTFDETIDKKDVINKSKARYRINLNRNFQRWLVQENKVKGVHKQMSNRREHYLKD
ncbi:MAG: hypothetical protein COB73_09230 [Flavobacteriaceae bacterium]|nr:MAG: hypothetical protein COB73_09230 [Flavobacteriaceae bacterium]